MKNIAVIVGSLRRESINRILANALEKLSSEKFIFTHADIGSLPHYNEDLWSNPPPSVLAFKQLILDSDAVLFVTPEYNRSIPGIVKNAIDWGSRPYGKSCWKNKPASIAGATSGAIGTAVAQSQLRIILPILEVVAMGQPEIYFQFKPGVIDADLNFTDEKTKAFMQQYLLRFEAWIDRLTINER